MKRLISFFAILIFISGVIVSCSKDDAPTPTPDPTLTFIATLSGVAEVPANASAFTGSATLKFDTITKIFTIRITHTVAAPTLGHIHKAAVGVSGGVIYPFTSLTSPIDYTSAPLTAAQEADLRAHLNYVNIHTAAFPAGEIRGQLIKQ